MTISDLKNAKKSGNKFTCLTAYDALFARIVDDSKVEIVLVGDSLGMVVKGDTDTLKVSMSEMIYHTKIVAKQVAKSLLIVDLPYLSYERENQAVENANLLINAGADMVKLEGGEEQKNIVKALINKGISVCGHLGLQPQSIKKIGGYKVQGRSEKQAAKILSDAIILQQIGVDILVIECVPADLAQKITQTLKIPTIGIGAGINCDGQVLVSTDILGIGKTPSFAKNFLKAAGSIQNAVSAFDEAVKNQTFPQPKHSF